MIFEGVPEVLELKREALARASALAGPRPIIASTTSTILVDDLSGAVDHPERFLNAHWLNPAYLVPLVELSPGARTDPAVTARLKALLEGIGKVPVVCAARPGYIVPRIQALAMNEAARMVEEGVATRGGHRQGDQVRLRLPLRRARHARIHRLGRRRHSLLRQPLSHRGARQRALRRARDRRAQHAGRPHRAADGQGFLDYAKLDIDAYRRDRLAAFVAMLRQLGLARPPVLEE